MSSDDVPSTLREPQRSSLDAPLDSPPAEPPVSTTQPAPPAAPVSTRPAGRSTRSLQVLSWLVVAAGIILIVAGAVTWFVVRDQLADEKITVAEDAEYFAGDDVDGPLTAYSQADIINEHALEASGGKTYAELERDDPARQTVMTASFLRASLFTSVVAFGVAAFAAALGVLMIIVGLVLLRMCRLLSPLLVAQTVAT